MKRSLTYLIPDLVMGLGFFLVTFYTVLEIGINGISTFIANLIAWPIILLALLTTVSMFLVVGYSLRLQIRHEVEIEAVSDYYERALDSTNQGLAIIDRNYKVKFQNSVVETNFGNAIRRICYEVYSGRNAPCEGCMVEEVIDTYKPFTTSRTLQDGRIFEITLAPFKDRDGRTVAVETMKDVTEKKKLQDQLERHAMELEHEIELATRELKNDQLKLSEAYKDLQELDRLKTQFFSNVSHELKTPLTVIKAHLHFLKTGKLGELTEKMKRSVDVAMRETLDLEDLVEMILDLAKLDAGNFKLDLVQIVITDIAEDVVERMAKNAEAKGQNLILNVEGEIPMRLIDPRRMKQALMNLVSNAIKYNPENTTTMIRLHADSENIIVDVTDDGIGIEKEELDKIFDRFYQVDGSTTRSGSGTGIGLSIVKELVELHGGTITVESEPGVGSTFRILLPIDWQIEEGGEDRIGIGRGVYR
ncbi:hypothetical protein DRN98_02105 [Methanosarcinales archaeon]|nr:MAG: hypothetical protein DRN98_02105 [Methanosarcinales archaeon]